MSGIFNDRLIFILMQLSCRPSMYWVWVCVCVCVELCDVFLYALANITTFTTKNGSSILSNASRLSKEHCILEGPQASPICRSWKSNIWMMMSVEHWWKGKDRGEMKYSEKNLPHYHFIHLKSHMKWPEIEPRLPRGETKSNVFKGECEALVEGYRQGRNEVFGEKSAPLPLHPPQMSHEMTWDRTQTSTWRGKT